MIVTPEFCDHWKTQLLVKVTGDESAPLCVLRLWAFCQTSRRWEFPDMTAERLATICRWDERKPACHLALLKCGFVDRLKPRGFAAHDWDQFNARLVHNWEVGQKGGRPAKREKANESGHNDETQGFRLENPERTDTTRPDQTRPEPTGEIPYTNTSGVSTSSASVEARGNGAGAGVLSIEKGGGAGVGDLVKALTTKTRPVKRLALRDVREALRLNASGLVEHADAVFELGERQHWCDKDGTPLSDPRKWAIAIASGLERHRRGVGT